MGINDNKGKALALQRGSSGSASLLLQEWRWRSSGSFNYVSWGQKLWAHGEIQLYSLPKIKSNYNPYPIVKSHQFSFASFRIQRDKFFYNLFIEACTFTKEKKRISSRIFAFVSHSPSGKTFSLNLKSAQQLQLILLTLMVTIH